MKKFIYIAVALLGVVLSASCTKDGSEPVTGCWRLISSEIVPSGQEAPEVYIQFNDDKTFSLYQKIVSASFEKFSGSYSLADNVLNGTYDDGTAFGSTYKVSREDINLVLTPMEDERGVKVYEPINQIPDHVLDAIGHVQTKSAEVHPFL